MADSPIGAQDRRAPGQEPLAILLPRLRCQACHGRPAAALIENPAVQARGGPPVGWAIPLDRNDAAAPLIDRLRRRRSPAKIGQHKHSDRTRATACRLCEHRTIGQFG
jgi:hypothetical protein